MKHGDEVGTIGESFCIYPCPDGGNCEASGKCARYEREHSLMVTAAELEDPNYDFQKQITDKLVDSFGGASVDEEDPEPSDDASPIEKTYTRFDITSSGFVIWKDGRATHFPEEVEGSTPTFRIRFETNDDDDDGYVDPSGVSVGEYGPMTAKHAFEMTGVCRRGLYNQPVDVTLDGALVEKIGYMPKLALEDLHPAVRSRIRILDELDPAMLRGDVFVAWIRLDREAKIDLYIAALDKSATALYAAEQALRVTGNQTTADMIEKTREEIENLPRLDDEAGK